MQRRFGPPRVLGGDRDRERRRGAVGRDVQLRVHRTIATAVATAELTSPSGGYSKVRPTIRPRTAGSASAFSQLANASSGSVGSPPNSSVGIVVESITRSISSTTGNFIQV